jgi:hypothetical protein
MGTCRVETHGSVSRRSGEGFAGVDSSCALESAVFRRQETVVEVRLFVKAHCDAGALPFPKASILKSAPPKVSPLVINASEAIGQKVENPSAHGKYLMGFEGEIVFKVPLSPQLCLTFNYGPSEARFSDVLLPEPVFRMEEAPPAGDTEDAKQPGIGLCIVCMEQSAVATFVHGFTGHTVCCMRCGQKVLNTKERLCPVCKKPVERMIRNYTS